MTMSVFGSQLKYWKLVGPKNHPRPLFMIALYYNRVFITETSLHLQEHVNLITILTAI